MNQRIRHLTVAFMVLFSLLFLQLSNWQYIQRDGLVSDTRNNRVTIREFDKMRGAIVTADNSVIAATEIKDPATGGSGRFQYQRVYPTNELFANVTGYYTLGFGSTQLERTYNDVLIGTTPQQQLEGAGDLFSKADTTGSVHLTLRNDLQIVARDALGGREGSAVVMDPRTGAVLAMYSNPTYDPNLVASHSGNTASETLTKLQNDPRQPLLANAYQERYMPGSTFKVLTTTIALETGVFNMQSLFKDERSWLPPNTKKPLRNYGNKVCGGDLAEIFRRSCNIPFAQTAVTIGPDLMVNGVNKFGFEEAIPFDLPGGAASTFGGHPVDFVNSLALLAIHGFGQGSVQVVPLHMAMIASTVANGGKMMQPYVVANTRARSGTVMSATTPTVWKTPMFPETAATLTQLMMGVVQNGTASCCLKLNNGIQAAAKTGTAQLNPEGQKQRSHAWIMAFAPAQAPRVAVAVMIKGVNDAVSASTGGRLAGPVAQRLLNAALPVVK